MNLSNYFFDNLKPDMEETIKNAIIHGTNNIFIMGPGGTGKSYLIKSIVEEYPDLNCAVTATTGVAAVNIGGVTLHRFFGVGLATEPELELAELVRTKRKDAVKNIRETKILIVDEISMISNKLFEKLDFIARYIRESPLPFGGIRIIASGDFMQLPSVEDNWVFQSECWKVLKFQPFLLTTCRRFTDIHFYRTLMRVRKGRIMKKDYVKIKERVEAYSDYLKIPAKPTDIKPTKLYSLRADVEEINNSELEKLPGEPQIFLSKDEFTPLKPNLALKQFESQLDVMAPKSLSLKVGAQVMITWNINVENGLCNGTRGVITSLSPTVIKMTIRNGEEIQIERITYKLPNKRAKITRSQFPLILAFALTIHKCQGATLDFCVVDLGTSIFSCGQGYVAMSRARDWNSLLISNFTLKSIKADAVALEYVEKLESDAPHP